jgi:hypothetical protein
MIKEKLITRFGKVINHMSCIYLNDGESVLRYFLEKCQPKVAVEIGTYQGVSAAIIAEYAKEVHTFDIVDKPLRQDIWNMLRTFNIKFNLIKNENEKKGKIKSLNFDFAFIDGEHYHKELLQDFECVKKCKHILVHDYSPEFKEVYDFCNNITGYKKEIKGTFCLLTNQEAGGYKHGRKSKQRQKRI